MGIPGLISYIKTNFKTAIEATQSQKTQLLLIDGNCQLYKVKTSTIGTENSNVLGSIVERFGAVVSRFNTAQVHIVLDGIPPLAKIQEQKKRREKRKQEDTEFVACYNNIFTELEVKPIRPNFTLGTEFMESVNSAISAFCQNNKFGFSSIYKAGEGEQKIFQYLQTRPQPVDAIIDSGDCDVILLGLMFLLSSPQSKLLFHIELGSTRIYINLRELYDRLGGQVLRFVFVVLLFGSDFFMGIETQCLSNEIINTLLTYKPEIQPIVTDPLTGIFYLSSDDTVQLLLYVKNLFIERNVDPPSYLFITEEESEVLNTQINNITLPIESRLVALENLYELFKSKKQSSDICRNDCKLCTLNDPPDTRQNKAISYLKMLVWTINYFSGIIVDHSMTYSFDTGPSIEAVIDVCKKYNKVKLKHTNETFMPLHKYIEKLETPCSQSLREVPYCNKHPIKSKYQSPLYWS